MRSRHVVATLSAVALLSCATPAGTPDIVVGPAQASRPIAGTSQIVLTLTNRGDGDDALVGVDTASALGVESHLTEVTDGRVTMRELDEVALPAGSTTRFQPGGLHLMLVVPDGTVVVGATFEITLRFARSPARTVSVEVVELLDLVEDDGS